MSRVLVTVYGGVAEAIIEDENLQVLIVDYDVDGQERVVNDHEGNKCVTNNLRSVNPLVVARYFDHFKVKGE